jgi:hypothetical protein
LGPSERATLNHWIVKVHSVLYITDLIPLLYIPETVKEPAQLATGDNLAATLYKKKSCDMVDSEPSVL